jgi:hypothetical protein
MATLEEVRAKYPQYSDMSDVDLANALHRKFYKDIPLMQFYKQAGVKFEREYDATDGMSTTQRTLAGIGRGMSNIGRNLKNIVGMESDESLAEKNAMDADLLNTRAGSVGNFIGEAAAITPLTLGIGAGLGAVGRGTSAASRFLGNPLTRGGAEGAAQGFVSAGPGNRGEGAVIGGAFGTALPAVGGAISTAAKGLKRTPDAQALLDRGVSLTPGQMNPTGMVNQIEESLQSVPLVGSVVRSARDNAEQQFNRAAVGEVAAAPISTAAKTVGEQLDEAYKSFAPLYAQGKGFPVGARIVNTNGPDVPIADALGKLGNKPRAGLVPADRTNEVRALKDQLNEVIQAAKKKGGMDSNDLLKFRSTIREAKRGFSGPGAKESAMRKLYDEADDVVTQALDSQLPPSAMAAVRTADKKYGSYKVLEDAVSRARDRPNGFTGTMLSQAVRDSTPESLYARGGGGPLRDLAKAASNSFEVRAPATGVRLGTIGAAALFPTFGVPIAGGLLGLAGTQTGRKVAAGQTVLQRQLQAQIDKLGGKLAPVERDLLARYARGLLVAEQSTE